jgi:hypothetical protein
VTARRRAALALLLLLSGCASPRESLEAGRDIALGALDGAGRGALAGLRVGAECRRDCAAVVPVTAGLGALVGTVAGAAGGLGKALARLEKRHDARDAGLGIGGDVDVDGLARGLEGGELAVEE